MSDNGIPTLDELLKEVSDSFGSEDSRRDFEANFKNRFDNRAIFSEAQYVHLKGIADHYWHKGWWSWFMMLLLLSMVGFQFFLLWKVGTGRWDFTAYSWLLPVLLVQNLGQIIGLAFVVVRSLFR